MCSWCWGFKPVLQLFEQALTAYPIEFNYIVGGLAPDSDMPMPIALQQRLQATWQKIQQTIPGTRFNYDFWQQCQPRRSTYRACRAVLAAQFQGQYFTPRMITAIQEAYYLQAKNPSDCDTLYACATSIGLDLSLFKNVLDAPATQAVLDRHIEYYHSLAVATGIGGFPSLVLSIADKKMAIPLDYNNSQTMIDFVKQTISILSAV